jgi:hypothetical protein
MKKFKKKHTKLPKREAIIRLLARESPDLAAKYIQQYVRTPAIIPQPIREACLAEFDPGRRSNIRYYPDLHNFQMYDAPNRSLPVPKFLNLFRQFIDPAELTTLETALTAYRVEFVTDAQKWIEVYADPSVKTCMTANTNVRCFVHPENHLALAVLYAPGGMNVAARTIVNTEEKWYVRLFGDALLVDKLAALGYRKLSRAPSSFKMYGVAGPRYVPNAPVFPYFDFTLVSKIELPQTHDPATGLIEVIINPGIQP